MKARELAEILMQNPDFEVRAFVEDDNAPFGTSRVNIVGAAILVGLIARSF